jgi:hypothetical protein
MGYAHWALNKMYKPWLVCVFASGGTAQGIGVAGNRGGIDEVGGRFEVLRIDRVVQHGVDTGRGEQESRRLREGGAETDRQREIRTEKTGC